MVTPARLRIIFRHGVPERILGSLLQLATKQGENVAGFQRVLLAQLPDDESNTLYVAPDVQKESIAGACAPEDRGAEVVFLGTIGILAQIQT